MTNSFGVVRIRCLAATVLVVTTLIAVAPAQGAAPLTLKAVRFWSLGEITRIAIETGEEIEYRSDRAINPDRIFFDFEGVRPRLRKVQVIPVGDKLLKQIRIAETSPGTTRVVLDLAAPVEFTASQLSIPNRIIIELRHAGKTVPSPPVRSRMGSGELVETGMAPAAQTELPRSQRQQGRVLDAKPDPTTPDTKPPATVAPTVPVMRPDPAPAPKKTEVKPLPATAPKPETSGLLTTVVSAVPAPNAPAVGSRASVPIAGASEPLSGKEMRAPAEVKTVPQQARGSAITAKADSHGDRSLIRALGLKLERVVLDPGHGGHDTGTIGKAGYMEKDLVLDVAKRLGDLIEKRLGSSVIYTRNDDTFLPLEARTATANDQRADLFLSIHANSGRLSATAGPETFYMNLTSSQADLDVAARENSSSTKSIFELQDIVRRIATNEKIQESREFAASVQKSLFAGWARGRRGSKDRGVKKAPFVVLIGAQMPSVLAEIAFLSNPKEERLLRRPDYRQRIAEALFKGVSQYASTLSHFQLAASAPH